MGPVGRKLVFQAQAIRKVLGRGYDVAVFEGSLSVISNTVLLALRHMMRAKNIIWLKGWPNADGESPAKRIIKRWYLRLADGFDRLWRKQSGCTRKVSCGRRCPLR